MERLAKEFSIQKPEDWGKITAKRLVEKGGGTLLFSVYKGGMFKLFRTVFPGILKKDIVKGKISSGRGVGSSTYLNSQETFGTFRRISDLFWIG